MQRGTLVVFGVLVVAAIAVVALRARSPAAPKTPPAASARASASAALPAASSAPANAGDGGIDLLAERSIDSESRGYGRMPDGGVIPELSGSAPKTVSFGVILFGYKGAQFAPSDAPTKEQAEAKARALLGAAQQDFADAVKKGDRGSTADAGRIPRGVLEPYLEYLLFTLEKAKVHPEPVDTPRGYWIVRRND